MIFFCSSSLPSCHGFLTTLHVQLGLANNSYKTVKIPLVFVLGILIIPHDLHHQKEQRFVDFIVSISLFSVFWQYMFHYTCVVI